MMSSLFGCNTLVISPGFNPASIADEIQGSSINQLFMVPTMLRMMLDQPGFSADKLASVNSIRYGGSPMDSQLVGELAEFLPQADFMQVYGQTEGLPITFLHQEDHAAGSSVIGSAGRGCLGIDLRIIDSTGGQTASGEPGEVTARGPGIMLEYWNKSSLTEETLQQGWLKTGDIGYLDGQGYLYLVDRAKDMIITGGENVYSAEVEKVILAHEFIAACAVVGLPDRKWGEKVHAEIVLAGDPGNIEAIVDQHCHKNIAGYKCPKSYTVVESLPLTAVGKVNKVAIRSMRQADATVE